MDFLSRKEIDEVKWDQLIAGSTAETIYPYSWYLDAVSDRWSAMVVDDYRFVMPVVWRKKAGIKAGGFQQGVCRSRTDTCHSEGPL